MEQALRPLGPRARDALVRSALAALAAGAIAGCAVQTPPPAQVESTASIAAQRQAQAQITAAPPAAPVLKQKIALGRVTNETTYGRSLLRDQQGDPLGKQATDMVSKVLTETGRFVVLERPDIGRLTAESALTGQRLNLVGVDVLVVGSVTEFGRKVVGETGFLSQTKKQVAFAKVDLRLVDATTAQVLLAASGAGESSTETGSVAGFGSQASYDGTLNDSAIRAAVTEAVSKLSAAMSNRPWRTSILRADGATIYLAGGKTQGLRPGLQLAVQTAGERVRSPQTGFDITLPGRRIATLTVSQTFGDTEASEGAVAQVSAGSLEGQAIENLTVTAQ